MKANPSKHLLLSDNDSCKITIGNKAISTRKCDKLYGIKITIPWTLRNILNLVYKSKLKTNALASIASSMNLEQRRRTMNYFVMCHFLYCPVVWMFLSRKLNARIKRLHERALRIVKRFRIILWRATEERQLHNFTPTKSIKTNDWNI